MQFDVKTVDSILKIDESYKAPERMMELMLNKDEREETFDEFLKISKDMSFDWFHEYFEDEQAERKSKKQDFTPQGVAAVLTRLTNESSKENYYEPAAGTGGILITKWWQDCLNDPIHKSKGWPSMFTYDPRSYWYHAEELSDRAIPFLLFNMSIRGMNGVVVQCDVLERKAKDAWFIENNTNNFLSYSNILPIPHTDKFKNFLGIEEWIEDKR